MKLDDVRVAGGAVRSHRKNLLAQARAGVKKVRLVRSGGKYLVAVHNGPVYVTVCSPSFAKKGQAIAWCVQKTRQKPPTRAVAA